MKYWQLFAVLLTFHMATSQNVEHITLLSGASIDSLRHEIESSLFGGEIIPKLEKQPSVFSTSEVSEYYATSPYLASVEKSTISLKHGFTSVVYHFQPRVSNGLNIPVIYHSGHGYGVFLEDDFVNFNYGKKYSGRVIDFFLSKGFQVIGIDMPFFGENEYPHFVVEDGITNFIFSHDNIFSLKNPFYYFLAPVKSVVNYYQEAQGANQFIMFGLSGGGWATTLYSAIDTRITLSFPVAGSIPVPLRINPNDYGDMEQYYFPFYDKYNYSTLYLLGAAGENRMQYQILNKNDDCCFALDGNEYWVKDVQSALKELSLPGKFDFYFDTVSNNHRISSAATDSIHLNILNNLVNNFLRVNNSISSSNSENVICDNDTLLLSIPNFGNNTIKWFKNGMELTNAYSLENNLIVPDEGIYYAQIVNFSEAVTKTDSIRVRRNLIFTNLSISERNGFLCSPYGSGNQWYYNDAVLQNEKGQCIRPTRPGRYRIKVSAGECHSDFSPPFDYGVSIFPNPVEDKMIIRLRADLSTVSYLIRRTDGVCMEKGAFVGETTLNIGKRLMPGIYFLELTNLKGFRATKKFFVKQ